MSTLLLEEIAEDAKPAVRPRPARRETGAPRWLIFRYSPVSLFSLKMSRATSTAGKTLLIPTPYAVKMAFVDAALRHRLTDDPDGLVRSLAKAAARIGVPRHACVTGTIQSVRQQTREFDRKRNPNLPWYLANIAMREFVHFQGELRLAFEHDTCHPELIALLQRAAPAINYLGKRGSFFQYLGHFDEKELDATFTFPIREDGGGDAPSAQRATLDDFGKGASFDALNSYSPAEIKWEVHRKFVETAVPYIVHNSGPGFTHYCAVGGIL
jgi:hypothetical protein